MSVGLPAGKIIIAPRAIASIAAYAASRVDGVVGMAPHRLPDEAAPAFAVADAHHGVEVWIKDGTVMIDVYVFLAYGAPITDVAMHVRDHVRAAVEQALNAPVQEVRVRVQGLRRAE